MLKVRCWLYVKMLIIFQITQNIEKQISFHSSGQEIYVAIQQHGGWVNHTGFFSFLFLLLLLLLRTYWSQSKSYKFFEGGGKYPNAWGESHRQLFGGRGGDSPPSPQGPPLLPPHWVRVRHPAVCGRERGGHPTGGLRVSGHPGLWVWTNFYSKTLSILKKYSEKYSKLTLFLKQNYEAKD